METIQHFVSALWSALLSALVWLGLASSPVPPGFQGYVEGQFILVAPTVGGALRTLSVRRGMTAHKGDPLFAIDQTAEAAARDQAAAAVRQAQDLLENLTKGKRSPEIDSIAAQKVQAEAQLRLAEQQLQRQRRLAGSTAFRQEQFDQAVANRDGQKAQVDQLTAQLAMARMALGREDEIRAAQSQISANKAALAQTQWRLDQKTVSAPASGLVVDTYFDPGETVNAGQPVVSLLPPENTKVRFFVPETRLADIPIGAPVIIRCDGCPKEIAATVRFVSPQAEFTPPVLYNRENRKRLVFLVEAYPAEPTLALRPGQPVDVIMSVP